MGLTPVLTKSGSLAPGFRFHPTDEELASYYLKRKVCGKPFRFEAISDIEVYKFEPWDLSGKSRLKTRDLEWYFFSALDKKYGNGSRTNRATERGYWKTTGKDRGVSHSSRTVGMKKTLVYYTGRAPRGERTNWVMHEYRIVDETLQKSGIFLNAFVLCKIFKKSGSGPKNGEQYGAPFVEEEWDDDELVMAPGEDARREEAVGNDAYKDGNDGQVCDPFYYTLQIIGPDVTSGDVSLPFGFYYGDNSTSVPVPLDFADDALKLGSFMGEGYFALDQPVNYVDPDYLLDEPFFDASNMPVDEGEYLENDDLSKTFVVYPSCLDMVEEYLPCLDADNGNLQFVDFDSPNMMGSENLVFYHSCLAQKHLTGEAQQENMESEQVSHGLHNDVSSLPSNDLRKLVSDIQPPIVQRANRMLDSIPAPPAFALEFPTKDALFCCTLHVILLVRPTSQLVWSK